MKRTFAFLVCVIGAVVVAWAGAGGEPVTLEVRTIEFPSGALPRHGFAGHIASGAAGELVTVLAKVCPRDSETAVAGATTNAGGAWEAEAGSQRTAITYRARWEGRFCESVKVWSPIFVNAAKAGPRSVIVFVDTSPALQNLNRKFVQLQRFDRSTGRWRLYKRARLRRSTGPGLFPFNYTTTFTGVARGLTVRVLVPRKTAVCADAGSPEASPIRCGGTSAGCMPVSETLERARGLNPGETWLRALADANAIARWSQRRSRVRNESSPGRYDASVAWNVRLRESAGGDARPGRHADGAGLEAG